MSREGRKRGLRDVCVEKIKEMSKKKGGENNVVTGESKREKEEQGKKGKGR